MFGAYCAEKIYRNSGLRVLVIDAGSYLVSEHVQNLARIGLNAAGAARATERAFVAAGQDKRELAVTVLEARLLA